jgi:hypothetical protein
MAEGLIIRLTHAGNTSASILVDDVSDGTDGNGHTGKPGACYVPEGGTADLVYSSSVAKSYEDGVIRGFIDNGELTAAFVLGDGLAEALGRTYRVEVAVTGTATTNAYIVMPSACKIVSISAFAATAPVSGLGSYTVAIGAGAGFATNLLAAATFDLESLVAVTPAALTVTASADDLELADDAVVRFSCVSDAAITSGSGLQFVVVTS